MKERISSSSLLNFLRYRMREHVSKTHALEFEKIVPEIHLDEESSQLSTWRAEVRLARAPKSCLEAT
jgi:hypothetical protein